MTEISTNDARDPMCDGLPEKIKVTISREDGSPLFSRDQAAQVEYLTDAAPVLVIRRDGGSLNTIYGDIHSVGEMFQELLEHDRRAKHFQREDGNG